MEGMIGYCGYDCSVCAARSGDEATRARLVDGWRKLFGHEAYTVENVCCDGCRGGGRHADEKCSARPCAESRGVESCALCDEFPCDRVRHLLASREGMMVFLHSRMASLTEEEYCICARQFESMPTLVRIMAGAGRLPGWVEAAGKQER